MKSRIVRIGNSRGIRIPKPLLEQAGLEGEVRLRIVDSGLVIEPVRTLRAGWRQAAERLRTRGEDGVLDEEVATEFDESDWRW